jgi:hypothetical protein
MYAELEPFGADGPGRENALQREWSLSADAAIAEALGTPWRRDHPKHKRFRNRVLLPGPMGKIF